MGLIISIFIGLWILAALASIIILIIGAIIAATTMLDE